MSRMLPLLQVAWGLDDRAVDDLRRLSLAGVAGHIHANNIASKLVKKNAMDEPIHNPSRFVSKAVKTAWAIVDHTNA